MIASRTLLAGLLAVSIGGCGTPGGVGRPAQDGAIQLVKELAIGQADGPPEYALGRSVGPLAAVRSGTFFLYDGSDRQIRRYDVQGRYLGLVGRSGSGPGEYQTVAGMVLQGDSLLLVYDPPNGRISIYDTAGGYRRQITSTRFTVWGEKAFAADDAGRLAVYAPLPGTPVEGPEARSQYLWMALDGTIVDSIALPARDREAGQGFVLMTADGPRWHFPTETVYALLPDGGLASGRTSEYRISVNPRESPPLEIAKAVAPVPLENEEREEWEAFAGFFARRRGSPPARSFPSHKPVFRDLLADDSGRLWVHRYVRGVKRSIPPRPAGDDAPLLTIREVNTYDLWSPARKELGTVELAPHSRLLAIRGDRIYVRREAEGGEYVVERYLMRGLENP